VCGNKIIETGESCDGTVLGGKTCLTQGFTGGTLACSSSCQFNTASCTSTAAKVCGNKIIETGESCDGTVLGGKTCLTQGFTGGTLACSSSCLFNTFGCTSNLCGNGVVNSGEQCDGSNLAGKTCVTQGFTGGTLTCNNSCALVTSGCSSNVCGNGVVNSGEQCDGGSLAGKTCVGLGFKSGTLGCTSSCKYNTSGCTNVITPVCGNNVKEIEEQCDTTDFGGQTCQSIGYSRGTLACTNYCQYNVLGCR
jgi:hypothetical protein